MENKLARLEELRKKKRMAELQAKRQASLNIEAQPKQEDAFSIEPIKEAAAAGAREVMDVAGRTIDLPFGLIRTGMAATMEPFTDKNVVTSEDVMNALTGNAPSYEEYLVKAGYDPNSYLTKGAGLAGELVSGMGGEGVVKALAPDMASIIAPKLATTVMEEIGPQISKAGKSYYKSAFDKIDELLENRFGKEGVGELLNQERFAGSQKDALKYVLKRKEEEGAIIGALRDFAENLPEARAQMPEKIPLAEEEIAAFKAYEDPKAQKVAANLEEIMLANLSKAQKSPKQLAKEKNINKNLAGSENALFNMLATPTQKAETKIRKAIMSAQNKAEEEAMGKAIGKEGLKDYKTAKEKYGVFSEFTQKQLEKEAAKEANRTGIWPSAIDVGGLMLSIAKQDPAMAKAMIAKKGRDILRMTPVRTNLGLGIQDLGAAVENASPYIKDPLDIAARNLWVEMLKQEQEKQK